MKKYKSNRKKVVVPERPYNRRSALEAVDQVGVRYLQLSVDDTLLLDVAHLFCEWFSYRKGSKDLQKKEEHLPQRRRFAGVDCHCLHGLDCLAQSRRRSD